jgi:8-amino-7-oxononanoate synthase
MSLAERWNSTLEELRKQDRFRSFARPLGHDFTSNDYLGYASSRGMVLSSANVSDSSSSLPRSGMASRLLRGHHEIWERVESELSQWHGAEAVLMMSSGYAANEGLLSTVLEPGDWVVMDDLVHACIHDGLRLAKCRRANFRHNDLNHLESLLQAEAEKPTPSRERFIITESFFSMDGDRASLAEIAVLAERYGAHIIVDEAHSTGCYGTEGSGCVDALGLRPRVLATMHTGGKALGVPGAYLVGSRLLKDYLINRCRHLIFSTALPAICGQWWCEMLPQVKADAEGRRALHVKASRFRQQLQNAGVPILGSEYVVPVVLGDNATAVSVARNLQGQGFDIRAIRPPSVPVGTSRLRISIHADHDDRLLDALATSVIDAVPESLRR